MKSHAQSKEFLTAFARIWKRHADEKAKDGTVGKWDWSKILAKSCGDLFDAIEGFSDIPAEAADYTTEELNDLYESFLRELNWQPTMDTKDRFFAAFTTMRDLYTNLLRLKNTIQPPRAEIAP